MEYYLANQSRKKARIHKATWINCTYILLSERIQNKKKLHIVYFHLYDIMEKGNYSMERRLLGVGNGGRG